MKSVAVLSLVVIGLLAVLSVVPNGVWDAVHVRPINIFSDLLKRDATTGSDEPQTALLPKKDAPKDGVVGIEDFEEASGRGMDRFYEALRTKERVRIAVFGDSFIEGDILIGRLRELLQEEFGGSGVGFVKMISKADAFRPTIKQKSDGFQDYCVMRGPYNKGAAWLSGYYFTGNNGASVKVRGTNACQHLDSAEVFSIYVQAAHGVRLEALVDNQSPSVHHLKGGAGVQKAVVEQKGSEICWKVQSAGSRDIFYGVALDGKTGVSLDNFSLRGSSGFHLSKCDSVVATSMAAARPYDLVVLQYGMNFCQPKSSDHSPVVRNFRKSVAAIRQLYPNAAILLLSIGDRGVKDNDGVTKTPVGVRTMVEAQRNMAAGERIAFWNLYKAMGGENSMVAMVHAKPSLANKDYLHINFRGGNAMAQRLFDALQWGMEQYKARIQ